MVSKPFSFDKLKKTFISLCLNAICSFLFPGSCIADKMKEHGNNLMFKKQLSSLAQFLHYLNCVSHRGKFLHLNIISRSKYNLFH